LKQAFGIEILETPYGDWPPESGFSQCPERMEDFRYFPEKHPGSFVPRMPIEFQLQAVAPSRHIDA